MSEKNLNITDLYDLLLEKKNVIDDESVLDIDSKINEIL